MKTDERLAIVETKIDRIETTQNKMDSKLDILICTMPLKADKSEVSAINAKLMGYAISLIGVMAGIIGYLIVLKLGWV